MPRSAVTDRKVQRHHRFHSPEETTYFATRLAPLLGVGDVILLQGDLGAGKTHFARSIIQARMATGGHIEDVPSPTFTLVQTYELPDIEIWHADLYRLSGLDDVFELGLDDAFKSAVCFVEWPDRLGSETPTDALNLTFSMTDVPGERVADFQSNSTRWADVLDKALING